MNILYGVVGEGMGHATRSRVILEHLLAKGHEIRVVVSGKAHNFLWKTFRGRSGINIEEIQGLTIDFMDNAVNPIGTIFKNLFNMPDGALKNTMAYLKFLETGFFPDLVISDFES